MEKDIEEPVQEESAEDEAARREEEQKSAEMISHYYGDDNLAAKRTIHAFVMEGDDLFNDDLIDALDASPTYLRGKNDLGILAEYRK